MNQRTSHNDFAEVASLKVGLPLLLLIVVALFIWGAALALGFALGALGGLVSSYFSWLHLVKIAENMDKKSPGQVQRAAFGGTLASVALMALVLAAAAAVPWLNLYTTAAGLFAPKLLIGLFPFLRRI